MTLTDAERERYGKIAFATYAQRQGELGRFLFNWDSCGKPFHERWGDLAAAVVTARDADRTAEVVAVVRGWRDEALAAAHALSPDMDSSFGRFQHFMIKIAAYDRMLALLGGDDATTTPRGDYRQARAILPAPDDETPEALIRRSRDGGDDARG